jgi:RimJ/RimL family protein N-acetyltransferase
VRYEAILTERLLLRPIREDDADALAARRNDPAVAVYQNWTVPYPLERARQLVAETVKMDGPVNEEWWTLTIANPGDDEVLGDLVVHLTWDGRCAEIGYTLARSAWGHGFAVEAVTALVGWLWKSPITTRVHGMLHPDNIASAQVLERTGFVFEGRTRRSFWVGDDNSDDAIYGMTRDDWSSWQNRTVVEPRSVTLALITPESQRHVSQLRTHASQERFVAPMGNSFANALFPPVVDGQPLSPWLRSIDVDGRPVGFVMLSEVTDAHPEPYLWRFLVDRLHQRRGIGAVALDLILDHWRELGARSMLVSWVEGRGSPASFYLARGFIPTGDLDDGEIVARLTLD